MLTENSKQKTDRKKNEKRRRFKSRKENGIATIWLDHRTEKMNVVSPDMMGCFTEVFHEIKTDNEVKGVVIISAKKDFIAGADIKAFAIEKKGDFKPIAAKGHAGLRELKQEISRW
ncbi:MAG: enoyl-CoA hydratase-related protein [Chitinophagales bacterium]